MEAVIIYNNGSESFQKSMSSKINRNPNNMQLLPKRSLMKINKLPKTDRREFLGSLATGAAAIGMSALPIGFAEASGMQQDNDLDAWFGKLKGKHKMVFDAIRPHGIYPFAWPRVFMLTNEMTGAGPGDTSVMVVLRHEAICYAFEDRIWEKYKFGEVFKASDPATSAPSLRNPFAKPKPGEFKVPGVGPVAIGINELQESGVLFCVCNMALTVFTSRLAESMKMDPAEVKKDWMSGLLPGIRPVPSGVWAVGRAQERGCAYCVTG